MAESNPNPKSRLRSKSRSKWKGESDAVGVEDRNERSMAKRGLLTRARTVGGAATRGYVIAQGLQALQASRQKTPAGAVLGWRFTAFGQLTYEVVPATSVSSNACFPATTQQHGHRQEPISNYKSNYNCLPSMSSIEPRTRSAITGQGTSTSHTRRPLTRPRSVQ
jgi:hypothetical protein